MLTESCFQNQESLPRLIPKQSSNGTLVFKSLTRDLLPRRVRDIRRTYKPAELLSFVPYYTYYTQTFDLDNEDDRVDYDKINQFRMNGYIVITKKIITPIVNDKLQKVSYQAYLEYYTKELVEP